MKNKISISKGIKILMLIMFLVMIVLPTIRALAATGDSTVLAPLPGTTSCGAAGGTNCTTNLGAYLPAMFNLLIGLSAVVAVLMIVYGGFQYISSDAIMGKSAGKERMKNAIFGLVCVIGAWLILNEINPNLLKINLKSINPDPVSIADTGAGTLLNNYNIGNTVATPGVKMTQDQIDASNENASDLAGYGIGVNAGPCTEGQTTGCTNLNGLTQTTITGLEQLTDALNCGNNDAAKNPCLVISGGTEAGHDAGSSHADGTAVDIRLVDNSTLANYIIANGGTPAATAYGPVYTVPNVGGSTQTMQVLVESNPPHYHVTFK